MHCAYRFVPIAFALIAGLSFAATPDFETAHRDNVTNLQRLVQIDTTNPPGNESKAAIFLKAILDREGIPSEIVEKVPGRGNLIARLKGNGKKKPLLLMGHTDVVGVEREKWTVEPFAGAHPRRLTCTDAA